MEPSLTPCAIYIYSVELSHCRVLTFFTAEQLNYETLKISNQYHCEKKWTPQGSIKIEWIKITVRDSKTAVNQ